MKVVCFGGKPLYALAIYLQVNKCTTDWVKVTVDSSDNTERITYEPGWRHTPFQEYQSLYICRSHSAKLKLIRLLLWTKHQNVYGLCFRKRWIKNKETTLNYWVIIRVKWIREKWKLKLYLHCKFSSAKLKLLPVGLLWFLPVWLLWFLPVGLFWFLPVWLLWFLPVRLLWFLPVRLLRFLPVRLLWFLPVGLLWFLPIGLLWFLPIGLFWFLPVGLLWFLPVGLFWFLPVWQFWFLPVGLR